MEIDAPTYLSGRGQSFLGWKALTPSLAPGPELGPEKPFSEGVGCFNNSSTMASTIADFVPEYQDLSPSIFTHSTRSMLLIWLHA